jgi:signal transduction histidine kinase
MTRSVLLTRLREAAERLRLLPHFYRRAGPYPLIVAAVGTAAWGAFRSSQRQARVDAVLAERNRIAREIHDTLAQDLLGVSLQVEGALGSLGSCPATTRRHLERAQALVRESLAAARRSVWDLRDPTVAMNDLVHALACFAEKLAGSSETRLEMRLSGQPRPLPERATEHLLRISQEAITNAVRHARAQKISIELSFSRDRVILRVKDDGCGFTPGQSSGALRFGLVNMAERAQQMAARLAVRSEPGNGTEVEVEASA